MVVIKYVPYVGDSKRAMDEYTSEIFMGGRNTIVLHNTCEDSLLAAPIILDLVLLAELLTRVQLRRDGEPALHELHPVAALLSYLTKAPLVPEVRRARPAPPRGAARRGTPGRAGARAGGRAADSATPVAMLAAASAAAHGCPPPRPRSRGVAPPLPAPPRRPQGVPVVNALSKQRAMLENFCRACIGLPPDSNMMLEFK